VEVHIRLSEVRNSLSLFIFMHSSGNGSPVFVSRALFDYASGLVRAAVEMAVDVAAFARGVLPERLPAEVIGPDAASICAEMRDCIIPVGRKFFGGDEVE